MAAQNLPSFPLAGFAQLIPALIERQITQVNLILAQSDLGLCDWESPESSYGACDGGYSCHEKATVHHLASEHEYCLSHFREVNRG